MRLLLLLVTLLSFNVSAESVNINSADAKTIASNLKGIGIKKANAIVKYRKKHGSFKSIEDLENVKGIGKKTIQKNRSEIRFKGGSEVKKQKKKIKKAKQLKNKKKKVKKSKTKKK
jgi:competence protein ComEA